MNDVLQGVRMKINFPGKDLTLYKIFSTKLLIQGLATYYYTEKPMFNPLIGLE